MTLVSFSKRKSIAILISFLITFMVSRIVVYFIENKIGNPFLQYNMIGDLHIHHYTYGIIILVIIGFVALFIPDRLHRTWLFLLFGLGLGLIFDEFGILLKLDAKYDQELSILAVFIISLLLTISAFIEHEYRIKKIRNKINTKVIKKRKKRL